MKNLKGLNFTNADLRGSDFRRADLSGAKLTRADLRGVSLEEANLTHANLVGADLREANLQGAILKGANLASAELEGADFRGAQGLDFSTLAGILSGKRPNVGRKPPQEPLKAPEAPSFPIEGYDDMNVGEAKKALSGLSTAALKQVLAFEEAHKNRKGVLGAIGDALK